MHAHTHTHPKFLLDLVVKRLLVNLTELMVLATVRAPQKEMAGC